MIVCSQCGYNRQIWERNVQRSDNATHSGAPTKLYVIFVTSHIKWHPPNICLHSHLCRLKLWVNFSIEEYMHSIKSIYLIAAACVCVNSNMSRYIPITSTLKKKHDIPQLTFRKSASFNGYHAEVKKIYQSANNLSYIKLSHLIFSIPKSITIYQKPVQ